MSHDAHAPLGPAAAGPPAAGGQSADLDPRRWFALSLVLIAGFMDLLDATIVNVAIPSIQRHLNAQYAEVEWVVAAYALAFAAGLITGGRLGDIYGRKRLFLTGILGFTAASALCGISTSPAMLIGSRFFQGAMAALMVPQILSIIHVTFPMSERGKVFGMYGGIIGSASVAGPIVGGLLIQWNLFGLLWRPIFLVNVPVGIAVTILALIIVRESKSPTAPKVDLIGMVLAISAVLMLVYPLTEGRTLGWPTWSFVLMAGSVPVMAAFIAYERWRNRHTGSPLMVLSLFRARTFNAGLLVGLLFMTALGGFFLVWTLYMQIGLGWTPLHAGLTAVAFSLGAAPAAGLSVEVLTPRFGRLVLMAGVVLSVAGFAGYIWTANHYLTTIHSWQMIPPLVVAGIGFGLVVAPATDIVLTDVPTQDAGSASGLFTTMQQLGSALGVALIGVVFLAFIGSQANHSASTVVPSLRAQIAAAGVPAQAQPAIIAGFSVCAHARAVASDPTKLPASCRALAGSSAQLPPAVRAKLTTLLTSAGQQANGRDFSRSFGLALWYIIGVLGLVFLGMFALPRRSRPRDDDAGVAAPAGAAALA